MQPLTWPDLPAPQPVNPDAGRGMARQQRSGALRRHAFWLIFVALCALLIHPLWTLHYLPLTDIPDHAAQLRTILDYEHYEDLYRINWLTPYLGGYLLVLAFASVFPLLTAIKITLSICLLAVPLSLACLIYVLRGDRLWIWLAFPMAWSFTFQWGFLSYVFATPIAIGLFAFAWHYGKETLTPQRALLAALFSLLLFLAHAMAWAYAMAMSCAILAIPLRGAVLVRRMLPLLAVMPIVALWLSAGSPQQPEARVEPGNYSAALIDRARHEFNYVIDEFNKRTEEDQHLERARELFSFSVGQPAMPDFVIAGLFLLVWPLFIGARLTRDWRRYLPLATCVGFFMLVPYWMFETAYVYQRFAVFLIPAALFCYTLQTLPPHRPAHLLRLRVAQGSGLAVVLALLLHTHSTFTAFRDEEADFARIVAQMQPDKRVLQLIFDANDGHRFTPPWLHFGGWYQAEKRGEVFANFASDPNAHNVPVRYRPGELPLPSVWSPWEFNWITHRGADYDYFLVRSRQSQLALFAQSQGRIVQLSRQGNWQLYGRPANTAAHALNIPLPHEDSALR